MREPHIILTMQDENSLNPPITDVDDIAVTDDFGALKIFDSFDEAKEYQEEHTISGMVVELPTY